MKRIGFLYNHDAAHQVAHLAGIMKALALDHPAAVSALVSNPEIEATARGLIGAEAASKTEWITLDISFAARAAARVLDRLMPLSRLAALRQNLEAFRGLDALVSTERTCLRVKERLGAAGPKFIYVPHGSGDRNVAYHPDLARFDLSLFSGRKLVEAGQRFGIVGEDDWRIIGYPKLDGVDLAARPKLFVNDNPVFLYNPHFDPHLSSIYRFGSALIALFERHPEWNFVYAPHVMHGRKRLHVSLEFRKAALRRDVVSSAPNILIDMGSERSIDMTYTRAADVYIGDVSSQLYEFLSVPRAAIFLDSHGADGWEAHENYQFWRNGPVVRSIAELEALLPRWREIAADHRETQERLLAYTIDRGDAPASARGAAAIADYVEAL
ncbi:MAG: hypothetical protein H0X36_04110 [Sphingomonadaceae bacterium]|nr:hypothetical protein [Sphingomonadaceae bacterium]